jgi:LacI family transcriptional regulator
MFYMVTIYDVANATGFSPSTVSKALNSYPGVSKKTSEIILKTAGEMGYLPNITARALTTKKSWLVGMLLTDELATSINHPHFGEIISSAQILLSKAGYDVIFINNSLSGGDISYLEHCRYRGVDGVILASSERFEDAVQCVVDSDLKMVSVEMEYENRYSVISENYTGALTAMEHLYSLGHRQIAYISGPMDSKAAPERFQGYLDFLSKQDLPFDPTLIVESEEYSAPAGYSAAKRLLRAAKGKFTAVFADYDVIACAVINCFRSYDLKVPDDISVIGFDDLPIAEIAGLSTIRQDRDLIGCMAANNLISQMQDQPLDENFDIRIPTSLVIRSSCRKV